MDKPGWQQQRQLSPQSSRARRSRSDSRHLLRALEGLASAATRRVERLTSHHQERGGGSIEVNGTLVTFDVELWPGAMWVPALAHYEVQACSADLQGVYGAALGAFCGGD